MPECEICEVEHPPNAEACHCSNCICEVCKEDECPCSGAGEKANDDHDRSIFTPLTQRLQVRLPTISPS